MSIREKIDADIKAAMFAKDNVKKDILKFIKGEIQKRDSSPDGPYDEAGIFKVMRSQIENLKITPSAISEQEIAILESYLPALMDEGQIKTIVQNFILEKERETPGYSARPVMGDIMKHFNANFRGKADNGLVSKVAKEMTASR